MWKRTSFKTAVKVIVESGLSLTVDWARVPFCWRLLAIFIFEGYRESFYLTKIAAQIRNYEWWQLFIHFSKVVTRKFLV